MIIHWIWNMACVVKLACCGWTHSEPLALCCVLTDVHWKWNPCMCRPKACCILSSVSAESCINYGVLYTKKQFPESQHAFKCVSVLQKVTADWQCFMRNSHSKKDTFLEKVLKLSKRYRHGMMGSEQSGEFCGQSMGNLKFIEEACNTMDFEETLFSFNITNSLIQPQ